VIGWYYPARKGKFWVVNFERTPKCTDIEHFFDAILEIWEKCDEESYNIDVISDVGSMFRNPSV
jgi:hypothetical protein